jgi:pyruvate formate lyase activating enzyme
MMIKKAELYEKEGKNLRCLACSHKCLISEGKTGICGVRKNERGELLLLVYGRVSSMNVDPIEKKPLYHFLPGTRAFSIGTVGCNFKCAWCQNFDISQAPNEGIIFGEEITAKEIVEEAIKTGCQSIAYTYNEPAIWVEFVREIAVLAKIKGIKNILVTNGYFSNDGLKYLMKDKLIDAANVDLKSFSDKTYTKFCGAHLKPVLECIKKMKKYGVHVEITTLIIPGVNDDEKELAKIAKFIAKIDKNLPWHISRFFPMYKMQDKEITNIKILRKAYELGKKAGLKYVYLGNV